MRTLSVPPSGNFLRHPLRWGVLMALCLASAVAIAGGGHGGGGHGGHGGGHGGHVGGFGGHSGGHFGGHAGGGGHQGIGHSGGHFGDHAGHFGHHHFHHHGHVFFGFGGYFYPRPYYRDYCDPYSPYYDPRYNCYGYYPSGLAPVPGYGVMSTDPWAPLDGSDAPPPDDDPPSGASIRDGVAIQVPLLSSPEAPEALPDRPGTSAAGRVRGSNSS